MTAKRKVHMDVTEAPETWKGIATVAAMGLAGIAEALFRIVEHLERRE